MQYHNFFCLAHCVTDVLLTDAQVMVEEGNPSMEAFSKVTWQLLDHSVVHGRCWLQDRSTMLSFFLQMKALLLNTIRSTCCQWPIEAKIQMDHSFLCK